MTASPLRGEATVTSSSLRSLMTTTVPFAAVRIRASEVAAATRGHLAGPDVEITGAAFDSRSVHPGDLFVPIVAARDGHDFVADAIAAGAVAYLTSRPALAASAYASTVAAIEVADTGDALMALAGWARTRLPATVVGVTGSVGKTSTKDLVAAAVAVDRRVAANERSFNNEQGLPVTIVGAPEDTEVLVVEMGMRGLGEIARLCAVARPDVGVVTGVAAAHTERVGGLEGVARAKGELVDALPADGTALLNADDEAVAAMAGRTSANVVTFGRSEHADVRIDHLQLDGLARPRFVAITPWGTVPVTLAVTGAHMATNAAAALAVAGVVGVDLTRASAALGSAAVSSMRMQVVRVDAGGVVINDAYNANPTSMRAALEALANFDARRRIAVVGLMAELDEAASAHREIAGHAEGLGIELIAVGTDLYGVAPVEQDDVVAAVGPVEAGTAVLVKASRAVGLEAVAAALIRQR
jgi:UDP-N-acetylmuramoyl-tripeptide--D-alanyl-D-alanine ligase